MDNSDNPQNQNVVPQNPPENGVGQPVAQQTQQQPVQPTVQQPTVQQSAVQQQTSVQQSVTPVQSQTVQQNTIQQQVAPNQSISPEETTPQAPLSKLPKMPAMPKIPIKKLLLVVGGVIILLIGLAVVISLGRGVGNVVNENRDIEITWWGLWENGSAVEPIIAQYQQQHPNITITYVKQSPENYRERLANSLARGDGPDIFRIHNTWVPMFFNDLAPLPGDVMTQEEYQNTFFRVALESALTNEGIMAMPLEYDALGLFVNEELFTTFAQAKPNTWNEVRDVAKELTITDPATGNISQAGIAMGVTSNVDYWQDIIGLLMIQNRANLTEPSDEGSIGALKFFNQFYRSDFVWDGAQADSVTAFTTGRLAMMIAPASVANQIKKQNPGLNFRVVKVPQLQRFSPTDPELTYATFWMEGVSDKSNAKQQSWEFLKYLTQAENLEKLYQNSVNGRDLDPAMYPRQDMVEKLSTDRYFGETIKLAEDARFWYLADKTNDGETGLNTQLSNLFETVLNDTGLSGRFTIDLTQFGLNVRTLLAQYGLATPPPPPEE